MIKIHFTESLIAPCGMNCGICSSYLALKYDVKQKGIKIPYCAGCRPRGKLCSFLKKRCSLLSKNAIQYCFQCQEFPCDNLIGIDRRYRLLFHMSMVENNVSIKEKGIEAFLKEQDEKWKCPECGEVICCHNGVCFNCGIEILTNKKQKYRWGKYSRINSIQRKYFLSCWRSPDSPRGLIGTTKHLRVGRNYICIPIITPP